MDWLTFIDSMVASLVWPIVAVVAVLILRQPIAALIPNIRKLKYKDFEAEFSKGLTDLTITAKRIEAASGAKPSVAGPEISVETQNEKLRIEKLAEVAPNAAVLDAFRTVEQSAKALIKIHGYDLNYEVGTPFRLIERTLEKTGLLSNEEIKVFRNLRQLRNKVAHADDFEISESQAAEYISVAMSLNEKMKNL